MTDVGFVIEGVEELAAGFQQLAAQVQRNVARSTMRKAVEPVRQQALTNAPVGDNGKLADSIGVRTRRDETTIEAYVVATAPHAHLVEFGHRIVFGPRGGKQHDTGKRVKEHPFLEPAFDARKEEALDILSREIRDAIARALRRAGL